MFIGEHHHNLDEKSRLQVPAKWRSEVAAGAVIAKGYDGSLTLYPLAAWEAIAAKLAALPQSRPEVRAYVRQTLASAVDVQLDASGRFVVPPQAREAATLSKEAVLVGLIDHIEIWSAAAWKRAQESDAMSHPELAETLEAFGL
jgi:MraZ protein